MVIEFLFVGGAVCLSTPSTQIPASPGHGKGPVGAKPFGGRGWTSVPRGHRARGEVPRNLKTACLEQDAPQICAQGPPPEASPGCILAYFHSPSLHVSPQAPRQALVPFLVHVNHCLGLSFLSVPGAPVNMATWPLSGGKPGCWGCCKCCWEL